MFCVVAFQLVLGAEEPHQTEISISSSRSPALSLPYYLCSSGSTSVAAAKLQPDVPSASPSVPGAHHGDDSAPLSLSIFSFLSLSLFVSSVCLWQVPSLGLSVSVRGCQGLYATLACSFVCFFVRTLCHWAPARSPVELHQLLGERQPCHTPLGF